MILERHPGQDFSVVRRLGLDRGAAVVRHAITARLFLWTPVSDDPVVIDGLGAAQGITAGSRARREVAAHTLAALLRVPTPRIEVITIDDVIGTLREWLPGTPSLDEVRRRDPDRIAVLDRTPSFLAQRAAVEVLDALSSNLDRSEQDLLLEGGLRRGPVQCIPVGHGRCFPPQPLDRQATDGLLERCSHEVRGAASALAADLDLVVDALGGLLADAEVEQVLIRLADLFSGDEP